MTEPRPYEFGSITYSRPQNPVSCEDISGILETAGRDVIRLAWAGMNPRRFDYGHGKKYTNAVHKEEFASWLIAVFFLQEGQGMLAVELLVGLGLLRSRDPEVIWPNFAW